MRKIYSELSKKTLSVYKYLVLLVAIHARGVSCAKQIFSMDFGLPIILVITKDFLSQEKDDVCQKILVIKSHPRSAIHIGLLLVLALQFLVSEFIANLQLPCRNVPQRCSLLLVRDLSHLAQPLPSRG